MQIKIMLIGFLIGSSYLIGEYIYKMYVSRHRQINDLIRILEIIRMDLSFGMYTLEEIFDRVGDKDSSVYSRFFKSMSYGLKSDDIDTLDEILTCNIGILNKDTYLESKEVDEVNKLIATLGKSDVESQQRMIDLTIENLKKHTSETKEDITKKGMLYKKLVTFVGIGVCIVLF
ncbi:stage III sporulation protein AB [Metaclostridioides mangenotii]|uniref:stage III sporulation protein AB n=1 Tax=Metaclostridioides mangenotii TaxID=1540 RepID=UPI0028E3DAB4|nr:stage III sporulation protein AB [Clostridioides mangenotii]